MPQKHLILIFLLLFTTSVFFLFWQNARELDPDIGKNWWVVAFVSPQDPADLDFVIENHSEQTEFQYTITVDKADIFQDTVFVKRGAKTTIASQLTAQLGVRTSIIITAGKEKKEIYR